jgi:hypothetical protein
MAEEQELRWRQQRSPLPAAHEAGEAAAGAGPSTSAAPAGRGSAGPSRQASAVLLTEPPEARSLPPGLAQVTARRAGRVQERTAAAAAEADASDADDSADSDGLPLPGRRRQRAAARQLQAAREAQHEVSRWVVRRALPQQSDTVQASAKSALASADVCMLHKRPRQRCSAVRCTCDSGQREEGLLWAALCGRSQAHQYMPMGVGVAAGPALRAAAARSCWLGSSSAW